MIGLPLEKSFFAIKSDALVLSCIKKAEDRQSILIRLFNPTDKSIVSQLKPGFGFGNIHQCRLDEIRINILAVKKHLVEIEIGPRKIVTMEFEIK